MMLALSLSYINKINAKFDAEIWHVNINKKDCRIKKHEQKMIIHIYNKPLG